MDWTDDGFILATRKHGETGTIVSILTRDHGRHPGLVRGGAGKGARGMLQPGNMVRATWRARLPEHLGTYQCELAEGFAALLLDDPLRLAALSSACAVAETALPEREAHAPVFAGTAVLMETLAHAASWPSVFVKWELGLLAELGFGLDLETCAATGQRDDLLYVSPKSGRAVSREAGEPYRDVLLPLPPFLIESGTEGGAREVIDGLRLTGYFLERHVYAHRKSGLPQARIRLFERLSNAAGPKPPHEWSPFD